METKDKKYRFGRIFKLLTLFSVIAMVGGLLPMTTSASDEKIQVTGRIYESETDYEFYEDSTSQQTDGTNTYGNFCISGNIISMGEKAEVPSYEVSDGNLSFFYNYTDTLLNADLDSWHLIEDKSKKVADISLESNIMKGTIILQTSKDRNNWIDVEKIYNAFGDTPIRTKSLYSTTDVQLINGCFYRIIVVYKMSIRMEKSKFLFINTDKYDYKKCAEVYEFYAYTNSGESNIDSDQTYSLGTRVRVKNFDGYFGEELIENNDPHYGWKLGDFFVSGYTDEVSEADGNIVFLKNVGDKVTLWFKLNQNINALNGKKKLSITEDNEGYDQYFETAKMNFGRGVLIIRYTDHNNIKSEPIIYTNYLEANTAVGVNSKVQLFEEGDYEVALDYEITSDEFIDKISHYRIFFKFSVRNGNCMVYPFDVATGSELTNKSITENGFRLDLAKSRYLKINIKRELLEDSADGLVEDTRFNGVAKDGAEYTEEGIYTIAVSNEYTGQLTSKEIYVGTNSILKAYMTTGLSITEINNLVADGATISEDGTIQRAIMKPIESDNTGMDEQKKDEIKISSTSDFSASADDQIEDMEKASFPISVLVVVGVSVLIAVCVSFMKKKLGAANVNIGDNGGAEQ